MSFQIGDKVAWINGTICNTGIIEKIASAFGGPTAFIHFDDVRESTREIYQHVLHLLKE